MIGVITLVAVLSALAGLIVGRVLWGPKATCALCGDVFPEAVSWCTPCAEMVAAEVEKAEAS